MATARLIDVRCARDRLLDLLGIGETTPIRNVFVQGAQLTVNVGAPCEIEIDPAQAGVRYVLFDGNTAVEPACTVNGTGEKAVLEGPVIDKVDKTFRVHATKIDLDPLTRETFLLEAATVRIGLATALPVSTPEIESAPRCVDHGSPVVVRIEGSQAGATYGLIDAAGSPLPMTPPGRVSGNKDDAITLTASRLTEDTVIRVDVTRTFDASEGRDPLHAVLTTALPIAVRPDRARAVSAVGSPIEPRGSATITITGSQAGVLYSAHVRALLDVDFVPGPELSALAVPGAPDVAVYVSPPPSPWKATTGFVQHGDALPGNGGVLQLPVGPLQDDSIVVVQAHKAHTTGALLESEESLAQAAIVLVRPEPLPPLVLQISENFDDAGCTLLVSGGQPGVFYHFSQTGEASEIGRPAYFHKRDDLDASLNKGIAGALDPRRGIQVQTDFVVTRDPPAPAGGAPAHPLDPLVDLARLPAGGAVDVMAVKARTGLGWLARRSVATATVRIGLDTELPVSTPGIAAAPRCVDHGSPVVVRIEGSQADATYGLIDAAGSPLPMTPPGRVSGDKHGAITLTASRLTEDTVIRVDVTRTFDASEGRDPLHAVLTTELPIAVRPTGDLVVSAVGTPIEPRGSATITITGSQASVLYSAHVCALLDVDFVPGPGLPAIAVPGVPDVAVYVPPPPTPWKAPAGFVQHGAPLQGNGGVLELPVGPIEDDSIVVVQAHKIHTAGALLESAMPLAQAAFVLVRPEPLPPLVLKVSASADGASGTLLASGGQPGVFYHFARTGEASEIGRPAYFHKRDDLDAVLNKGIAGALDPRRGIQFQTDFVVTRDPPAPSGESPARVRPLDPLVDITPLPVGDAVDVMAVKARTGLGWLAKRSVAVTTVTPEPPVTDGGTAPETPATTP